MPGPITLTRDGNAISVPEDQAPSFLARGYSAETPEQQTTREEGELYKENDPGALTSAIMGAYRGATLGLSDVAARLIGGSDATDQLKQIRDYHPIASGIGEVAGSLLPIGPAGRLTDIGERVIAHGEGAGALGRAAATAAGSAVIGAGQSGGDYLSQVALDDKPLSAEGFLGAMGKGALFGGAAGGALSLSSDALMRAKALFPQSEVTAAAAQQVDREASSKLSNALEDGDAMLETARQKIDALRVQKAQSDLDVAKQINDVKLQQAQAKLEAERARTARAIAGPQRKPRKVFEETAPASEGAPTGGPAQLDTAAPAPAPEDDLLAKLQGTKDELDAGKSLDEVGKPGDFSMKARADVYANVDTSDAAIAAEHPEAAGLVKAEQDLRTARERVQDWLANVRSKTAKNVEQRGYRVSYEDSLTGGRSAAGVSRKLDRVTTLAEETPASMAARERTLANVHPADREAADAALEAKFGPKREVYGPPKPDAEAIVASAAKEAPGVAEPAVEKAVQEALSSHVGEHVDIGPVLDQLASAIGDYEKASANMAEALGSDAPPSAVEHAKAYRDAVAQQTQTTAAQTAKTAEQITDKLQPAVIAATGGDKSKALGKLADVGGAIELLAHLGGHASFLHAIPVVGPILSTVLKAKAMMGIIRRKGGSVGRTAETVIASKAAATRNRINGAVKKMLDTSAKAARKAATPAASTAAILSTQLFPGAKRKESKDPYVAYAAHMDDLARAQQPDALRQALSERIRTSDPALLDEITNAAQRKYAFLDSKAPKKPTLPTLLKGDGDWKPSRVALDTYARYVKAAEDPASVLEDVAAGHAVTPEAAETLRSVYPSLYAEAQRTLIEHASQMEATLPYARRISLSILFQVPADATLAPDHLRFLASSGVSSPQPAPSQSAGPGLPATPMLTGPVKLGAQMTTALDRRAGA